MFGWFKATPPLSAPWQKTVIDEEQDECKTDSSPKSLPTPIVQSIGSQKPLAGLRKIVKNKWDHVKDRIREPGPLSDTTSETDSITTAVPAGAQHLPQNVPSRQIDQVVVDRNWSEDLKSSDHSAEDKTGSNPANGYKDLDDLDCDSDSFGRLHAGFWGKCTPLIIFRWRFVPAVARFFNTSFKDPKAEKHYRLESWSLRKTLALCAAVWFIVNWALGTGFASTAGPFPLTDTIFYFLVSIVFTFPILFMVVYNVPRDHQIIYQVILMISVWIWPFYQILYMQLCDFYGSPRKGMISCGSKDFIGIFYYATAVPTIALFGLDLQRLPAAIGAVAFFIYSCAAIIPEHVVWSRNMINFGIYQAFLIFVHYQREQGERKLDRIRDELKRQYRATNKAQRNEHRSADSKRRLTSYIFHEVRVPLNTALLATQNLAARGVPKDREIELNALFGSLNIMSTVLNDVLDFNRMDSGRLESVSRPYSFHRAMRSLLEPMRITTNTLGLNFTYSLDPNIDLVARRSAYLAMGESIEAIEEHIQAHPDVDGVVTGDETRLRQIVTNLASNSCKFTPKGGKLSITTKLLMPSPDTLLGSSNEVPILQECVTDTHPPRLSSTHVNQHNMCTSGSVPPSQDRIIVRIEVADTGYGINSEDITSSNLFSAFNQTELGRIQGGKGTGLGLALVRQIVKTSGGRLGVQSKMDEGSTFWVELPLGIGAQTLVMPRPELETRGSESSADVEKIIQTVARSAGVSSTVDDASKTSRPILEDSTTTMQESLDPRRRVELKLKPTLNENSTTDEKAARVEITKPRSCSRDSQSALVEFDQSSSFPNPATISQASPISGDPMNVLVVDDDPLTRVLMTRVLTRLKCRVTTAVNGEMALGIIMDTTTPASESDAAAKRDRFDVIFLDNQMPIMSGLVMVGRLRELGRNEFVVGVTGNALLTDQNDYLRAGANEVLTKPVFERRLKDMLVIADDRRKKRSQQVRTHGDEERTLHATAEQDKQALQDSILFLQASLSA